MSGVRKGFLWAAVERIAPQAASFAVSIVLARLLSPGEYGLIGMLAIFVVLGQCFADCGLSYALIQRAEITEEDETSVFYLNAAAGLLVSLALCALSPLVARFFRQPLLCPLLIVLSLQVFLASLGTIQVALMTRAMEFRVPALIGVVSVLVSGGFGIAMALAGWGVWSLVGMQVATAMVRSALVWSASPWRPRGRFSTAAVRRLWPLSSSQLASAALNTLFENLYSVLIGRIYAPAVLGVYTRANQLQTLPFTTIVGVIFRVALPLFARVQSDAQALLRLVRGLALTTFGAAALGVALLIVTSRDLVLLLFGEKWVEMIPILRVLCLGGVLMPLHAIQVTALLAQGQAGLVLRLEIAKRILLMSLLALTYRHGVLWIAWGMVVFSGLAYFLNAFYNVRLLRFTWRRQFLDFAPLAGLAAVAGIALWPVQALDWPPLVRMGVQGCGVAGLYLAGLYAGRRRLFRDCWALVDDNARRLAHWFRPAAA